MKVVRAIGVTVGALALMTATSWFFATAPLWGPVVVISLTVAARRRTREARGGDDDAAN